MKAKLLLFFLSICALARAHEGDQVLPTTAGSPNQDTAVDSPLEDASNRLAELKHKFEEIDLAHKKSLLSTKIEHVVEKKIKKRNVALAVRCFESCALTTCLIMLSRYVVDHNDRLLHGLEGTSMLGTTISAAILIKFLYDQETKVLKRKIKNSEFKASIIRCAETGLLTYAIFNAGWGYRNLKFAFTGAY